MTNELTHPALKNHSRPLEMTKHVIKQTLKSVVKWGAVFAVAGALASFIPFVGPMLPAAMAAAGSGAIIGGIIGIAKGVSGMDEAADAAEEQRILSYDRTMQRAQSNAMFAAQQQRLAGGGMAASPGMLPMGKGVGGQGIG